MCVYVYYFLIFFYYFSWVLFSFLFSLFVMRILSVE